MSLLKKFLNGKGEEQAAASIQNNPFLVEHCKRVYLFYRPKDKDCSGAIEFQNGMTNGEQKFKGESIEEVLIQMKAFLENMQNNP